MRIVLVDPSRAVQRAMTRLIEEGGHEVVAFSDGLEALAVITQDQNVRAMITSTQPINISGIELCAAVRKLSGSRRALHVMLMSSTDDYYLAVTALDNGADDFIHKPPNPDELRARLRLADRVTAMKQQLIVHATTDPLTGLLNRRAFFDVATEMCPAADDGRPVAAIMFDVDHFKRINDTHGHEMGDQVLAAVGAEARMIDGKAGRLGGEEFCVLVSGDMTDALECAGTLQQAVRALRFGRGDKAFAVTCSFGLAEWETEDAIDRMLRRADMAMYEAKKTGRDRIIASDTFALTKSHDDWSGAARVGRRTLAT
jgi:diguanylate cyclase (GGDEF)-like protein